MYQFFDNFIVEVPKGTHATILSAGTGNEILAYLSSVLPTGAETFKDTDGPAEIGATGGYAALDVQRSTALDVPGVITVEALLNPLAWTASGADYESFRSVVIYDNSVANGPLICFYDLLATRTLLNGDTFDVAFGSNIIQLG